MQKFIVPMILAAFVLAGCGAKSGGTPITPSDSDTEATSVPSESDTSEKASVSYEVTLPVLHLAFYEKFADEEVAKGFKNSFVEYLDSKAVAITSITLDVMTPSADGATFATDLEAFEGTVDYTIDAILGGKGNLGSYITTNFSTLKNDGANIEYPLGEKTDRRLYIRNDAANAEAVAYLSQYIRHLAGLPEEEETSEDTSSEETSEETSEDISEDTSADVSEDTSEEISSEGTSEETSGETSGEISEEVSGETSGETSEEISEEVSGETSGETSEEAEIINLTVAFYERYASTTVQDAWNTDFCTYLYNNGYTLGTVFYTGFASGSKDKGAKFAKEVREYEESSERRFDVLLGGRANLGDETETFINDNFSVYKVDDVEFEYPLGDETNRKLFVRNDTVNTAGVEALVAYFTSIK